MNNLTVRLRGEGGAVDIPEIMHEAADEIERYAAQVRDMDGQMDEFARRELVIGHEAAKQALENRRLRATLTFIVSQQDHSFISPATLLIQCIEHARAALSAADGAKP